MKKIIQIFIFATIILVLLPTRAVMASEISPLKTAITAEKVLSYVFLSSSSTNELPPSYIPEQSYKLKGDADGNGSVNYMDAMLVLRHSVGLEQLSDNTITLCDVDGKAGLSYMDAMLILRYSIGLIKDL